jgi:hypothetical protein
LVKKRFQQRLWFLRPFPLQKHTHTYIYK